MWRHLQRSRRRAPAGSDCSASRSAAASREGAADPRIDALVVLYPSIPNKVDFTRPPPLLVLQGDADRAAPLSDSEALVRLARQSGGRAELVVYPGEGHRLSTWQQAAATDATERMIAFFRAGLTAPSGG